MTVEEIRDYINIYFNVDISKKNRKAHYVLPRFLYYKYAKEKGVNAFSLDRIGEPIKRHHTSVMYGLNEVDNYINSDVNLKEKVKVFENYFIKDYEKAKNIKEGDLSGIIIKSYKRKFLNKRKENLLKELEEINIELKLIDN